MTINEFRNLKIGDKIYATLPLTRDTLEANNIPNVFSVVHKREFIEGSIKNIFAENEKTGGLFVFGCKEAEVFNDHITEITDKELELLFDGI